MARTCIQADMDRAQRLGVALPGRRFGDLARGECLEAQGVRLDYLSRVSQRVRVTPDPVVQDRGRVAGKENDPALTTFDRGVDHRLDQRNGPIRVAAQRIDQHGAVRAYQGDRRQQAFFFQQRRRAAKVTGDDDVVGEEVERELKLYEASRLPGDLDLPLGQGESGLVVPGLGGYRPGQPVAGEPQQVMGVVRSQAVIADGVQCRGQRGRRGRVAFGDPGRDRVKDQICGARRILRRRCRPSGLRCLGDQLAVARARRPRRPRPTLRGACHGQPGAQTARSAEPR